MQTLLLSALLVVVLVASLLVLLYRWKTGVPAMSSRTAEAADAVALLREAGIGDGAVIYELGSGWGALVLALARAFPGAQVRGIELSPVPYWVARWRTRQLPNVQLRRADFLRCDLRDADALTCYLMIRPMPALAAHLDRQLRPDTPVVAVTFWFRDRQPVARRRGGGLRGEVAMYRWLPRQ